MRLIALLTIALWSFSICAAQNSELQRGIDFFERGEFEQAKSIFKKLSKDDNADAFYYLGLIHDPEFNRPPFSTNLVPFEKSNEKLTKGYYRKAADLGNRYANFQLGIYYHSMLIRRQDWRYGDKFLWKAREQLEAPAASGDWLAMYMLAKIAENSKKPYGEKALVLIENDAKKGNRYAQFYMGRSVSQWMCRKQKCRDYAHAYAWYVVSATQGSYHAKFHLYHLIKIMSKEEIAKGEVLANEFVAKYVRDE